MYLDAQNQYSDAQALTVTAASTNVIDHSKDRDFGIGEPMAVLISLDVAADATDGNETYTAALQTDTVVGFGSAVQVGIVTITRGDVKGSKYVIGVPSDKTTKQFTRLNYTLGGTTPSATVTAALYPQNLLQNDGVFTRGYTIS